VTTRGETTNGGGEKKKMGKAMRGRLYQGKESKDRVGRKEAHHVQEYDQFKEGTSGVFSWGILKGRVGDDLYVAGSREFKPHFKGRDKELSPGSEKEKEKKIIGAKRRGRKGTDEQDLGGTATKSPRRLTSGYWKRKGEKAYKEENRE